MPQFLTFQTNFKVGTQNDYIMQIEKHNKHPFSEFVLYSLRTLYHIIMDYTWGVPVQQAIMQQYGYGNHSQYPNNLTGYEQYYMGHPWMAGSYAHMYPFGMPMPGNQHMSFSAKEHELDTPPAAKKARLDHIKENISYHNHTSEILNADESTVVPDSFELPIDITN